MATLLYYCLLLPLSKLPLSVLYGIGRSAYWLGYKVIGYRTGVVRANMRGAFPGWSERELQHQMDRFYGYFFDTLAESIRLFSMPVEEGIRRCVILNPEVLHPYATTKQDVLVTAAHYCNWEVAGLSFPTFYPDQTIVAVYSPLANEAVDKLIKANRERNGAHLVSRRVLEKYFAKRPVSPAIDFFVADQSPSNALWEKVHWTTFLGRKTAFVAGPERYAVRNALPVFYVKLRLVGRGEYTAEFVPLALNAEASQPGQITEFFARTLEAEIIRDPTPWLWTHRRWKREVPQEVDEALEQQAFVPPRYDR